MKNPEIEPKKPHLSSAETQARRLQSLGWIIAKAHWNHGLVERAELRKAIYTPRRHNLREVRQDLNYWIQEEQIPFIRSLFNDHIIAALPFVLHDTQFLHDLESHTFEKEAIAAHIVSHFLDYHRSIFLDSGTTIFHVAVRLAQSHLSHDLRIVTNNLYILPLLAGKFPVKLVGGLVKKDTGYIIRSSGYNLLNEEPIQFSFISVTGISYDGGVYCQRALIEDKRQIIHAARQSIVFVANHSRIGSQSGEQFATFEELKALSGGGDKAITIVTDDHINGCSLGNCANHERRRLFSEELQKFHNANIHVMTVPMLN